MKKTFVALFIGLISIFAQAQDKQGAESRMFLPVDAGVSLSSRPGIGGAFYMRACLEYRFNLLEGLFITGELDTRTHPYSDGGIVLGNAASGDAAYTDILLGPGWRFMVSDRFKVALSLQGGVSSVAVKEVSPSTAPGSFDLVGRDKLYPAAKLGMMLEYYINPLFDLFLSAGLPATKAPVETASADPFVLFPTVSIGFSMAL